MEFLEEENRSLKDELVKVHEELALLREENMMMKA
jgi:hypothetical protein